MKIKLEYPYNQDWDKGYLVTNPENRKTIILFNSHKDRSSTAYARYLLAVSLGRYLSDYEQADHINNDKTDDRIENIQLLSKDENRQKQVRHYRENNKVFINLTCPNCGVIFEYRMSDYKFFTKTKDRKFHCSKSCADESKRKK